MDYTPVIEKIKYWREYDGAGDEYRKNHDLDCILTNGNLLADNIFSLWLPLRYALNFFESSRWTYWKSFERSILRPQKVGLKSYKPFLAELELNIGKFLPEHEITDKLIQLFQLGQTRCNVMILPNRSWNSRRGYSPYYDYLPHFLYDILSEVNTKEVVEWIRRENLSALFKDGVIQKDHLLDLAGTGDVRCHKPKDIVLSVLLDNYIRVLEFRKTTVSLGA